jgi:hypothetical protein
LLGPVSICVHLWLVWNSGFWYLDSEFWLVPVGLRPRLPELTLAGPLIDYIVNSAAAQLLKTAGRGVRNP